MKKVLFFDIDGTLLNSELKIPEGVKRELKRLKEAGHYLFVASGRPLALFQIKSLMRVSMVLFCVMELMWN